MSLSMYQASVPVMARALNNLASILAKGAAHVEAKKIEESSLVNFRLYPDMLPFARQIQIACDISKNGVARLGGVEPPKFEDTEQTFAELAARIQKTLAFVQAAKPESIDGSEDKDLTVPMRSGPMQFKGMAYLLGFVLPNIYFHSTTAYNILRHNGVELGKLDFIGQP